MIDLQAIVFSRLDDAAFHALICSGPEDEPAIYAEGLVPTPFNYTTKPLVIVEPANHDQDDDTFDQNYRIDTLAVRLYHKPDEDYLPLATAAEWVRTRFKNWGPQAVTGGEVVNTTVSGPVPGPTSDPTLAGRIVRLTFLIKET